MRRLLQDRDATGQPVDIDFVLALAGSERHPPAVGAAVGEEADGAEVVAYQVALRREQLDLDLLGQVMHARIRRNVERTRNDVDLPQRLAALRDRLVARK